MSDAGERTEQATDKRMKEVRSKGQLSKSQDLTAWLAVGLGAVMIPVTISRGADASASQLMTLRSVTADPDPGRAVAALGEGLGSIGWTLLPLVSAVFVGVVGGSVLQGGLHVKRFAPSFEHFDLVKGVGRVFGKQALWGGVKALVKTAVVGVVLWMVVQDLVPVLLSAGGLPVSGLIAETGDGAASLLRFAVAAGVVLAVADVAVVMRRNRGRTRMTKREVKDEHKTSEGDPLLRQHRRSRQLSMSRNRMISAVAGADVVLVNPTHVAVALTYEPGKAAPRVVAKGAGTIATRIRAEAEDKGVPMVRDVPLARALHAGCEIGQEIPVDLYTPVAGVLAFVMALRARGSAAGVHTVPQRPARGAASSSPSPVSSPTSSSTSHPGGSS
ncbi:flagellar biosynthesis protein FlhB [Terrabacter aerolatus]|uniref:Flagellar biosynthesis protein FlhB n=1 Tax=Terrabacter aerolatus TaxID=422442 RepID=A0A512CVS2_9MICO|nr:EscU/YscU/HrcU family type III secretion system export apparatus switch protein [Terrabacter aerolatus]GEO28313.1 flagellar biosynthesis protein FlhB [Terrabacter aerolatus]